MVRIALALAFGLILAPATARAQGDLLSRETLHGVAEVRLGVGDVARGWVDGGQGKSGLSDGDEVTIPRAALTWTPRFGVAVRGHFTLQLQPETAPKLDLNEAFFEVQAPPSALGKLSARVGVFYPPVSLEHTGATWTTPDTLSASAVNSWIGEEVLVTGIEVTLRRELGDHEVSATGAAFGWNDTAGTLLSFRGWALHGLTTGVDTEWELPPLSPFMAARQGDETYPVRELDKRAGYYGRLEWRPPAPVVLSAIYYDNAGDRVSVDKERQWAWETRFTNVGLRWEPNARTIVLAQAMKGETLMGFRTAGTGPLWLDVGYRAAYVLVRREVGDHTVTARLDGFKTTDRDARPPDDNRERGWAATVAWRRPLAQHLDLIVEGQHIHSKRAYRAYGEQRPSADEILLQTAVRASF